MAGEVRQVLICKAVHVLQTHSLCIFPPIPAAKAFSLQSLTMLLLRYEEKHPANLSSCLMEVGAWMSWQETGGPLYLLVKSKPTD